MTAVHDRPEARWLPSRHQFALFRLYAFARLRSAARTTKSGLVLAVDRGQSAVEQYSTAIWVLLSSTAYLADAFSCRINLYAAIAAAIIVAPIALHVAFITIGLVTTSVRRSENNIDVNNRILMLLLIVIAIRSAMLDRWVRWVGTFFLALIAVNALAAVIAWTLRRRIAQIESEYITP